MASKRPVVEEVKAKRIGLISDTHFMKPKHKELVAYRDGVFFVNPRSPNLPAGRRKGVPGTLAILDLHSGSAHVEVSTWRASRLPARLEPFVALQRVGPTRVYAIDVSLARPVAEGRLQ